MEGNRNERAERERGWGMERMVQLKVKEGDFKLGLSRGSIRVVWWGRVLTLLLGFNDGPIVFLRLLHYYRCCYGLRFTSLACSSVLKRGREE
jgi:hypothetical protein